MEAVAGFEPTIYRMQSEHCTTEHRKPSVNNFKTQKNPIYFYWYLYHKPDEYPDCYSYSYYKVDDRQTIKSATLEQHTIAEFIADKVGW